MISNHFVVLFGSAVLGAIETQLPMPCATILCDADSNKEIQDWADVAMTQQSGHREETSRNTEVYYFISGVL